MYTISKEFHFSASHSLQGLPDDHQCARLHGHNYIVTVRLTSLNLDDVGFVVDYGDLAPVKQLIDDELDHRHLNDVVPVPNPTAEHMARWFADKVHELVPAHVVVAVGVSETPKTWAWWTP